MAILEKEVLVNVTSRNINQYKRKGYNVRINDKALIKIEDLNLGHTKVTKICDDCGKNISNQSYKQILNCRKKGDGKDRCIICGNAHMQQLKKINAPYKRSLEHYANIHNKKYLIEEFSDKNKISPNKIYYSSNDSFIWKCKKCGSEYDMSANKRTSGKRNCPFCRGFRVNETNSLWASHPEVAKLLLNSNEGDIVTKGSREILDFRYPDCGYISKKEVCNVVYNGFSCPKCSDGISYPEKFMTNVLSQLEVEFEFQKTFSWSKNIEHENSKLCGKKIYDFYIPSSNIIIETHGKQHYNGGYEYLGGKNLEEEKENDKIKKSLAINNKINEYIVINCSISDFNYIKNSILHSELPNMFNLNNVDWKKCHEYASDSLVKKVCDFWVSGTIKINEISKVLNIAVSTVIKYLKQGTELGWCDYKPKELEQKTIAELTLDMKLIKIFKSAKEASKITNISQGSISRVCRGNGKSAGGYKWMYKEDYDQYIKQAN